MPIYQGFLEWTGSSGGGPGHRTWSKAGIFSGSDALLTAFMSNMRPKTTAGLTKLMRSATYGYVYGVPGSGANIDEKAIIFYRDPDDLLVYPFHYPCPIAADVEVTPAGKRIKQSVVIEVVGYLSSLRFKTLVPLYGVYLERV